MDGHGNPENWLEKYILAIMNERRDHLETRFREAEKALEVSRREAKTALELAKQASDKKVVELNELRKEVLTDRAELVKREVYEVEHGMLEKQVKELSDDMLVMQAMHSRKALFMWLGLAIAFLTSMASLIVEVIK